MTTAYATDERFDEHTMPGHPENAARLKVIRHRFAEDGLNDRLRWVAALEADEAVLAAVHTPQYLARLRGTAAQPGVGLIDSDTYVTPQSYGVARLAVGAVLAVVDAILTKKAVNGLAAVRPPGHHAAAAAAEGFCLLNNVAIAARFAQQAQGLARIAIVDYDVHHGNGTQDVFYEDSSVLYISTHQYPLYPGTGAWGDVGRGAGRGYTINIPLPPGTGDRGYQQAFGEIVLPALARFGPELILVSVGFDATPFDPLAQMQLSLQGYDALARALVDAAGSLCGGAIGFVLEGGYHLPSLSAGWANVAGALLGDPAPRIPSDTIAVVEPDVGGLLAWLKQLHKLD